MNRRWVIISGVGLTVLSGGLTAVWRFANTPASGTILQAAVQSPADIINTAKQHEGSYASYDYPQAFTEQPHPAIAEPVLDRQWFARSDPSGWQLSITVSDLPSGQVRDNGDYNLRATMPERFTAATSGGADVFTDTTAATFTKVAFVH